METLSRIFVRSNIVYCFSVLFSPILSNYQLLIIAGPGKVDFIQAYLGQSGNETAWTSLARMAALTVQGKNGSLMET